MQTEDLGMEKAQIVELVFSGGQILHVRKNAYHDILDWSDVQHTVAERVKMLHRIVLNEISSGLLDGVVK